MIEKNTVVKSMTFMFCCFFIVGAIVAIQLAATSQSSAQVATASWQPADIPAIYPPNTGNNANRRSDVYRDICTESSDLDCLESVEAFINGTWVSGEYESIKEWGSTIWRIPGLVNENGSDSVQVLHRINYTGSVLHQINFYADGIGRVWESNRTDCTDNIKNNDGLCMRPSHVQKDVTYRVRYRSSWVLPTALSVKLTDATAVIEKLPQSGATRVTVSGKPLEYLTVVRQSDLDAPKASGASVANEFAITMLDGRMAPVKKSCIELPTMIIAENGYGHPIPEFVNGELNLKVGAPHFRPDGVTQHLGYYKASIPKETARCLWGDQVVDSPNLEVTVIDPSTDTQKPAITSVTTTDTTIEITAKDYTYSSPIIRVRYVSDGSVTSNAPARPRGVKINTRATSVSVSFRAVQGVRYRAVATTKGKRVALKCKTTKKQVVCSTTKLSRGTWQLSITPSRNKVNGKPFTKRLLIR
jgi:hypothetical protein